MSEVQDLATLIRAGTPLVMLETAEEERAIEAFRHVVGQVWRPLYRWSITDGLKRLDLDAEAPEGMPIAPDATQTLLAIKQEPQRSVYLLCDFHPYLRYAMTLRLVRAAARPRFMTHPPCDVRRLSGTDQLLAARRWRPSWE